ncbi:1,2-phenylacetyl-CoA epoxidase subunit PaaC [Nocardioides sp. Arc9.136]|uniref:1,2-phenylacetyl-CoA epoxidase subunit PaaC n=1 Tax=Nocardioides sp. Arc9.136 TaxID=2996826 RepID=UPI002666CC8A|nr:1,2-phenylacetyl-CoA epoxidase subunit PaaC [Nocardioides sp. Arc9.136]WKN49986.1 phenylacetate-CoA oxygenase subunit PaaC [Nocardioides sp. Arc9.136]
MTTLPRPRATSSFLLGLADDALVTAQRLGWWVSRAPELEEDVALANIGLDQLGQARGLLTVVADLEGAGRTEDDLAYLRDPEEFRNVVLVERPQADFAVCVVRMLLLAAWQHEVYAALAAREGPARGVAGKAVKEVAYHLDHARHWVLRLGDGTDLSHDRAQSALDAEWPHLPELLAADPAAPVDPAGLHEAVLDHVVPVLTAATLVVPELGAPPADGGGRAGRHTAHLAELLAEMQQVARAHPGASW